MNLSGELSWTRAWHPDSLRSCIASAPLSLSARAGFFFDDVYLVVIEGSEDIVQHLLVEHGGYAAWHGRHDPDPVCGAAAARAVLALHVLQEGLGGRVVIHDGHILFLQQWQRQKHAFKLYPALLPGAAKVILLLWSIFQGLYSD